MLAALTLVGGVGNVGAQAPADSAARRPALEERATAPGDSTAGLPAIEPRGGAAPDGGGGAEHAPRMRIQRGRFDAPRWVMLRSLVLPGWGQLYNHAWLKAAALGGGETALIVGLVQDDRRLRELKAEADRAEAEGDRERQNAAAEAYNARLSQFVSREWLLGGLLAYALMDAYVDAHFHDFKLEFEHDPALPGGKPASGQTRLALRWTF